MIGIDRTRYPVRAGDFVMAPTKQPAKIVNIYKCSDTGDAIAIIRYLKIKHKKLQQTHISTRYLVFKPIEDMI